MSPLPRRWWPSSPKLRTRFNTIHSWLDVATPQDLSFRGTYRPQFSEALFGLIKRRQLTEFFEIEAGRPTDHYTVRPRLEILPQRAKALSPTDRVILAVIVGLYRGDGWPEGFKRDWNPPAAEAFSRVNTLWPTAPEDVRDFYTLFATYPGW